MTETRVALVTGASSGIGRAVALAFSQQGIRVGATARRIERLNELSAGADGLPGRILPIAADVTHAEEMQNAVRETVATFGRLDILIANAGLGQRGTLVESAWEDLEIVLRTNIDGVLHSIRAAVPEMRKSGGGHIVTVSSVASAAITPYATTYAASKAALNAFARGLRVELNSDRIWVTNILVGQTATEFSSVRRGVSGRVAERLHSMTAEQVAQVIVRSTHQRRRSITVRWLDRLIVLAGGWVPSIMDSVVARVYRPR